MSDTTNTKPILTLYATTGAQVKNLAIKDGQLIFIRDRHRVALDFNGKRTFYNQIEELNTEQERASLLAPVSGIYYFIIDTAALWTYQNGWIQITKRPEEIVFIGESLPELGNSKTLYVSSVDGDESISIWDEGLNAYRVVANRTYEVTIEDIENLFGQHG